MELAEKEATVWVALDDLAKADLLTTLPPSPQDLSLTRRNLIKKAAAVGLALPIIESILAPTPAQGATTFAYQVYNKYPKFSDEGG